MNSSNDIATQDPAVFADTQREIISAFNKKTNRLYELANSIQKKLKTALQENYSNELAPNHKSSCWDPYKERHNTKVNLARNLMAACQTPIDSFFTLQNFLSVYFHAKNTNQQIDPHGGKLGRILDIARENIKDLNNDIYDLTKKLEALSNYMLRILSHSKVINQQLLTRSEYFIHHGFDFHIDRVTCFKKLLAAECADVLCVTEEMAKQKINHMVEEITICWNKKKSQKGASFELFMLPYLNIKTDMDLLRLTVAEKENFTCLSDEKKLRFLLIKSIITEFSFHLENEEKRLFLDSHIKEENNIDNKIYPTRHMNRLKWYKNCYQETAPHQSISIETLSKNHEDPLHTKYLVRDLINQFSYTDDSDLDFSMVLKSLHDIFEDHLKSKLNPNEYRKYKVLFISNWKSQLKNLETYLSEKLILANYIVQQEEASESSIQKFVNEKEMKWVSPMDIQFIQELVKMIKPKLHWLSQTTQAPASTVRNNSGISAVSIFTVLQSDCQETHSYKPNVFMPQ
ncbi:MAG: hypothetical protein KIT56_03285 [Gammaproteobacteria bacterium]|nr:hypothetical protein [Gammaproteobacteria bacterium]MCW5582901.1 hypothetical protein [Gammaproteobacteria bacterium]